MRISTSELAMLTIAFNGETRPGSPKIKFKTVDIPEWFLEMISRSDLVFKYSTDAEEVIITSIDRDGDIRKVANIVGLYEPRVVLYNNRWIVPTMSRYYLTDANYSDFMEKFEKNANVQDDAMIKPFGKMDDIRLFLVLNFLFKWSKGKCYEEKDITTFECSYNTLPDTISVSDLTISNKITILPHLMKNGWSGILYIQVDSINLVEMLDIWYMREIIDSDVETAAKEYFSQPLCMYLLNAFHQFEIERSDYAHTSPNEADIILATFLNICTNIKSTDTKLELFQLIGMPREKKCAVSRHLFNRGNVTELTSLDAELDILIKKSDLAYRDVNGDIVCLCTDMPVSNHLANKNCLTMLEEYVAGTPYHGMDYCISRFQKVKRLEECEVLGTSFSFPIPKVHGEFHSAVILNEFANYHIENSNILEDSDMKLFISANIKKSTRVYGILNTNVIRRFLNLFDSGAKSESDSDFNILPDKIDNPLVWDLGINGMIDFLGNQKSRINKEDNTSMQQTLMKLRREIPKDVFQTGKSSLMTIAQSDMNYVQEEGENLILVCAALNRNTYKTCVCTEYLLNSVIGKSVVFSNGLSNLKWITSTYDIRKIKELLGNLLTTNRIPVPIRVFGCEFLKNLIIQRYGLICENRKEFNAILNILDNYQYSNAHILEEYYTSSQTNYFELAKIVVMAYNLDAIPAFRIGDILGDDTDPDTLVTAIDVQECMLRNLKAN